MASTASRLGVRHRGGKWPELFRSRPGCCKAIWHLCDCNSRKLFGVTVEEEMKWRMEMRIIIAAGLSITAWSASASAAPIAIQSETGFTNQVEQVAYRRCWWADGVRHCRWTRDGNRMYRYGAGSPEDYRVGTSEWYRAMERDDRINPSHRR